ncbi:MAG: S1 RNA-binding domain-containing protein [Anaerolineae bacterium]|nr:S1 RNA-binding domain-containing protein [Anaerolineae bacterium]
MDRHNGYYSGSSSRRSQSSHPADAHRTEHIPPPPPPDESYWAALLREGEASSEEESRQHGSWGTWDSGEIVVAADSGNHTQNEAQDWELVERAQQEDRAVELPVIGYNRGGLLVQWNSLRGFVPASQLLEFPNLPDGHARRAELSARVGQRLHLRVIELSQAQNRLVLSERAAAVEAGARAGILDRLQPGDTCEGRVTNLCEFGAFVDLGGLEGLIHISELSWGRVGHPKDVLNRGDMVKVYVMEINRDHGRIALSLKRMQPDPWETVEQRYQIGQIIEGLITNVVDFGAFACVEEGLEGLIHVSELAEGSFLHPRNVVHEGERIRARILNINGQARRLGLSLRHLDGEPISTSDRQIQEQP